MFRPVRLVLLVVFSALILAPSAAAAIPDRPDAELISSNAGGLPAGATEVALAGGGRYAAFVSAAADVVPGQALIDSNATCDVFRRDLRTGDTVLVSRAPGGNTGSDGVECSSRPRISSEGQVIAFSTRSADLQAAAGGTATTTRQVLVADLTAGTLKLASRADGGSGAQASDEVSGFDLSGDGTRVAFSSASALAPGVNPAGVRQIWLRDLTTNTTTLASAADGTADTPISDDASDPSLDQYGLRLAFTTIGSVWVRLPGQITRRASRTTDGTVIDGFAPAISASGTQVAFLTRGPQFNGGGTTVEAVAHQIDTQATRLVSHPAGAPGTPANSDVGPPAISAQGRIVAFATRATNLGAGDPGGHAQVYVADERRGLLSLASPSFAGTDGANGDALAGGEGVLSAPSLAQGGIAVAYTTRATNTVAADSDTALDAVVRRPRRVQIPGEDVLREATIDGLDGRNVGLQRRSGGALQGTGISDLAVSADGRWIAFAAGDDRYAGDAPGADGASLTYVRDRLTGEVESVSVNSSGALLQQGCSESAAVSISGDGRYVTFCSAGSLYRRDRTAGTTTLIDNVAAAMAAMSRDGRYVVFGSRSTTLAAPTNGTGGVEHLYRRDMSTGTTVRIDLRDGTTDDTGYNNTGIEFQHPSVSDDGRFVAFEGQRSNLQAGGGFADGYKQAYLRDVTAGRTYALNRAQDGTWGRREVGITPTEVQSHAPVVSADGAYVAFSSDATNLTADAPATGISAIYRRALTFTAGELSGPVVLVSGPVGGGTANGGSTLPAISASGGRVGFATQATNLLGAATPSGDQFVVRDVAAGSLTVASRADGSSGTISTGGSVSRQGALSGDGTLAAFATTAVGLDGDASNQSKVYTRTLPVAGTGTTTPTNSTPPSVSPASPTPGTLLTCATGSWTGSPSLDVIWLRDGAPTSTSGTTYTAAAADVDHTLTCRVTATNAAGQLSVTAAAVTVVPTDPSARVDGDRTFGATLTCTPLNLASGATVTGYAWLQRSLSGSSLTAIPSATAQTLDLDDPALVDHHVTCRVTVDRGGSTITVEAPQVFVTPDVSIDRAPEPVAEPRVDGTFTCGETQLRVRPAGTTVVHEYRWELLRADGGVQQQGATSTSPTSLGPLADSLRRDGLQLRCRDQLTVGAGGTQRAAVGNAHAILALDAGGAAPVATSLPQVRWYAPGARACTLPTYSQSIAGLTQRFTWTYTYLQQGNAEQAAPASRLKAGLSGAGQVWEGVSAPVPGRDVRISQLGISCSHIVTGRDGRDQVTRSPVVRIELQRDCSNLPAMPVVGLPPEVVSDPCPMVDTGVDTVIAPGSTLPTPPIAVTPSGSGFVATVAVGCGPIAKATSGCSIIATLVTNTSALRAQAGHAERHAATKVLATAKARVRRGKVAAPIKLRLSAAAVKVLRRTGELPTQLKIRRGKRTTTDAAPVLRTGPLPKPTRPSGV